MMRNVNFSQIVIALILGAILVIISFLFKKEVKNAPHDHPKTVTYSTGNLKGHKANGLYLDYLCPEYKNQKNVFVFGSNLTSDFEKNLKIMWARKIAKSKSETVTNNAPLICGSYCISTSHKMTYDQYEFYVGVVVRETKSKTDWNVIASEVGVKGSKATTAKNICMSIEGKDIVAYAMTELMPSGDGEYNKSVLEAITLNAGIEFLECIPALGDKFLSFGPFQFTSYALAESKMDTAGVSLINKALEQSCKMPGSVCLLQGDDHYRAGYMLAVFNIYQAVKSMSPKDVNKLARVWGTNRKVMINYCATAHHLPTRARIALKSWVKNYNKKIIKKGHVLTQEEKFVFFCGKNGLEDYSKKTAGNILAVN